MTNALPSFLALSLVALILRSVRSFFFNLGLRWQYIFLFSFLAACFLTPLCSALALKLKILDRPDWRKIHDQPTPLLGGVAITMAFSVALLLNNVFLPGMKSLLLGATFIFLGAAAEGQYWNFTHRRSKTRTLRRWDEWGMV